MSILNAAVQGELLVRKGLTAAARRVRSEEGASAIEYALLVGLIAVVIIAAVGFLGKGVDAELSSAGAAL